MNHDKARVALHEALNAILVALVALDGLQDVEVPSDAPDAALGQDGAFLKARTRFRELHEGLRGHPDFFVFESTVNEMVTNAVDVGFRVGISTRMKS